MVRSLMSYQAKRELLLQVAARYREAGHAQKTAILDEFIAVTGYARKYAIRLLAKPDVRVGPIKRERARRYGPEVQEALAVAWAASNFICAKRLVPFLPDLVTSLEAHGHLTLTEEVRSQLLAISPATADRLLQARRQGDRPRGVSTTKKGLLLKHQVPVRTFTDWDEVKPGFFEGDLVAHCGPSAHGAFLYSFVLTDIATGWTECTALRFRSQVSVLRGLDQVRALLPFPLLGLDTDNGGEFLNREMIAYCERESITFTRGRAYKKNDQCFVEQKNGSIVRQIVGYDRYEGEAAHLQLTELYRALRLYVNFFQPSVKLKLKRRDGGHVQRQYDAARTPFQRLQAAGTLTTDASDRLERIFAALDPVRLLHQIQALQDALWKHAIPWPTTSADPAPGTVGPAPLRFETDACVATATSISPLPASRDEERRYHRAERKMGPRTYRTRKDPFEEVHAELHAWLLDAPELTGKALLARLQQRYPGKYPDDLLRTLQRRQKAWRAELIVAFDQRLVQDDLIAGEKFPSPLRAFAVASMASDGSIQTTHGDIVHEATG